MDALRWLKDAGVVVDRLDPQERGTDAVLAMTAGDVTSYFVVEVRGRAPYPNELPRLRRPVSASDRDAQPLLVVPFVTEALGGVLTEAGWSWADGQGNFDIRGPGITLRQRRTARASRSSLPARRIPRGSGSWAIVRALVRFADGEEEGEGASALARQVGVSQPRASQVLAQLRDLGLVVRTERGRWRPHHEALLDRFLAEYPGPAGSEQYLYGLDGPTDAAIGAVQAHPQGHRIAVSADVGPDLVVAWRRPSVAILYAEHDIAPDAAGLVEAQDRHDANVIVRVPDDRSVFRGHELVATIDGIDVPLADETQMIWDLQDLGGADRLEAAGVLREWLLTHR